LKKGEFVVQEKKKRPASMSLKSAGTVHKICPEGSSRGKSTPEKKEDFHFRTWAKPSSPDDTAM